jgi:hypothetical protein
VDTSHHRAGNQNPIVADLAHSEKAAFPGGRLYGPVSLGTMLADRLGLCLASFVQPIQQTLQVRIIEDGHLRASLQIALLMYTVVPPPANASVRSMPKPTDSYNRMLASKA